MEGGAYDFSKVKLWCKDFLVDAKSMWLTPVNTGSLHWILVVIDFASKSIRYYDPLPVEKKQSRGSSLMKITKRLVQDLAQLQGNKDFVESQWSMEEVQEAPRQSNGYDCGVFVLEVMKRFAEGRCCTDDINCIERRTEYLNLILGL
jgi:sentrin-specific protease 1